jgi:catechol 2,3-dioxygenase-like lactoylglutathione lyase family enzyme
MNIKGIAWVGTRTDRYEQMRVFCRDVLGLNQTRDADGVAFFDLPNGDRVEIFSADSNDDTPASRVMAGFLVDDVAAIRAELEAKGVEFVGPVHSNPEGYSWTNFRAPDGNEYSLTYFPGHRGE